MKIMSRKNVNFNRFNAAIFGVLMLFTFMLPSCEKEQDINYILSEIDAVVMAENLLYLDRTISYSSSEVSIENYNQLKKVRSVQSLINESNTTVLYVLNYVEGGYVIISADKRMIPVLAHAEFGEFIIEDDILNNTGIAYWLSDMMDEHEFATTKGYPADVQAEINNITKERERNPDPVPVHISCANGRVVFDTLERFPVWGQGDGYNNLLPDTCPNHSSRSKRPPVGCGNTATAQMMKSLFDYSKYNGSYIFNGEAVYHDWPAMPIRNLGKDHPSMVQIQQLMLNLGALQNSTYSCSGTSNRDSNRLRFFRDSLKMQNAKRDKINSQIIRLNISNSSPVQLMGVNMTREMISYTDSLGNKIKKPTGNLIINGSHAWAVKGFKTLLGCSSKDYLRYLYYMDWGWDGYCNGWFWMGTSNTFNDGDRYMIYDLGE